MADAAEVLRARGTEHRLRCAVQLCTLRATGRFVAGYRHVPPEAVNHLAVQLSLDPLLFLPDPERPATESTQFDQAAETQARAFLATMSFGCRSMPTGDPNSDRERNPEVLAELIAHVARERDRDAFRALFGHFAPRLKAFFLRRGLDDGSAEDLAQETMLRIWRYAARFDPSRAAPSAWVFGIARNLRADTLRRELRRRPELDLPAPYAPEASPEAAAIHTQREGRLRKALHKLPALQQDAVRTAYFDDLSHDEAHRALGIPLGTLKTRLRFALARLRDTLDEPPA